MNTTTKPDYRQPALIGGVVMGVLSALPIVSAGNACCCLWIISGGMVAAYLLQQNQTAPLTPGDGALVGLLAGLCGALVQTVVSIPINLLVAPMEQAMLQRFMEVGGGMPPEMRDMIERFSGRDRAVSGALFIVGRAFAFMFMLFFGTIFSTIGGLLGSVLFRRNMPPGAIDPTPGG